VPVSGDFVYIPISSREESERFLNSQESQITLQIKFESPSDREARVINEILHVYAAAAASVA
jgi:hypothetical protein